MFETGGFSKLKYRVFVGRWILAVTSSFVQRLNGANAAGYETRGPKLSPNFSDPKLSAAINSIFGGFMSLL